MSRTTLILELIGFVIGSMLLAPPTAAQTMLRTTVGYADLDLGTPAGIAALDRRIRAAAHRLCAGHRVGPSPWSSLSFGRCVAGVLVRARPQVRWAIARFRVAHIAQAMPPSSHQPSQLETGRYR